MSLGVATLLAVWLCEDSDPLRAACRLDCSHGYRSLPHAGSTTLPQLSQVRKYGSPQRLSLTLRMKSVCGRRQSHGSGSPRQPPLFGGTDRSPIYTPLYQIKPPRCTLLKVLAGSTGSRTDLTALEDVRVLTPPLQMGPSPEKCL